MENLLDERLESPIRTRFQQRQWNNFYRQCWKRVLVEKPKYYVILIPIFIHKHEPSICYMQWDLFLYFCWNRTALFQMWTTNWGRKFFFGNLLSGSIVHFLQSSWYKCTPLFQRFRPFQKKFSSCQLFVRIIKYVVTLTYPFLFS